MSQIYQANRPLELLKQLLHPRMPPRYGRSTKPLRKTPECRLLVFRLLTIPTQTMGTPLPGSTLFIRHMNRPTVVVSLASTTSAFTGMTMDLMLS